ncbi:MAG TPA: sigma-70 family RNA polymerase sigma factor [Phycisphaerae bacterium]|nr:sigma-70 family RNA polymerase sigma factor [Phycisphaerae bacterium]
MPTTDQQLLQAWTARRDAAAFESLVRQYLDLVYAAARRQLQNAPAAEDATQAVFLILSQKAHRIAPRQSLGPWLLGVTRYACREARRADRRRQVRETRAAIQSARANAMEMSAQSHELCEARTLLDAHLARLATTDRTALILRYLEERPLDEVAARIGTSEAAAKKRITRAVEKLRALFLRSGITLGAVDLPHLMARTPAPHHLADSVLSALHAKSALHSTLLAKGATKMMFAAKAKMVSALTAGALAITATGILLVTKSRADSTPTPVPVRAAATAPASPAISVKGYDLWSRFPLGTTVTMISQISQPGLDQPLSMQVVFTLVSNAPDKIRISMQLKAAPAQANVDVTVRFQGSPAVFTEYTPDGRVSGNGILLPMADLARARDVGAQTLEIAGKKYACRILQSSFKSGQETTRTWISPDMPGGVVKMEEIDSGKDPRTITTLATDITAAAPADALP